MRSRTSRRSLSSSCSALPRQQYVHIALSPVRSSATARKRRLATSRRCSPHGTLRRCARSASASIHAFQDRHTHRVRTRDVHSTFATPSARGPHFVCLRRRSCTAVPVRRITPSFPPLRFPRVSAACAGSRTVVEVRMVPKFALQRVAIASVSFRSNPPCACASTMRLVRFLIYRGGTSHQRSLFLVGEGFARGHVASPGCPIRRGIPFRPPLSSAVDGPNPGGPSLIHGRRGVSSLPLRIDAFVGDLDIFPSLSLFGPLRIHPALTSWHGSVISRRKHPIPSELGS